MWKRENVEATGQLRNRSTVWSRVGIQLIFAGVVALTSQCTWSGLDAYSSEYGKTDGIAGAGGNGGGGSGGGSSVCNCVPGQECVLDQCETCTSTCFYEHKALRQGDTIFLDHVFDPVRKTVYVTSSRQDGQGPRRGYMAEVHTCRGTLLREFDNPVAEDGTAIPGLQLTDKHGDLLYSKLLFEDASKLAGYAVYDTVKHAFLRTLYWDPWKINPAYQGAWSLKVSSNGKVWMSGDYTLMGSSDPIPLLMQSDGVGSKCISDFPNIIGNGRAMATNNDDVYISVPTANPTPEVRILHYKDSACDVSACNCPMLDELPPLAMPALPSVLKAQVSGSVLIIGGFYVKTNDDWVAFLAQYNFASKTWNGIYSFDPTSRVDGVTTLFSNGSEVYAAMLENHDFADPTNTKMELFVFGFPITPNSQPQKLLQVPSLRAAFGLDLDGTGILLSGYSAGSVADGRTVRCTSDACP